MEGSEKGVEGECRRGEWMCDEYLSVTAISINPKYVSTVNTEDVTIPKFRWTPIPPKPNMADTLADSDTSPSLPTITPLQTPTTTHLQTPITYHSPNSNTLYPAPPHHSPNSDTLHHSPLPFTHSSPISTPLQTPITHLHPLQTAFLQTHLHPSSSHLF